MSLRFHRGPTLITVFHDARSPASSRILSLLRSRITPHAPDVGPSSPPKGGAAYLANAARHPRAAGTLNDVELEVKDRNQEPPTSDQWGTILSYLKDRPSDHVQPIELADSAEHEVKLTQAAAAAEPSSASPASTDFARAALEGAASSVPTSSAGGASHSIREGPLVVNWADGVAVTTEKGVERMLKELEAHGSKGMDGGKGGCSVC